MRFGKICFLEVDMSLWGNDILEREMYDPILRLFNRYYSRGWGQPEMYVRRPYAASNDIPDCVFCRAYNQIHIVEAKRFASDAWLGLDQLMRYRGNYKYLALPDGEYWDNSEYIDELIDGRCGLVIVGTGNGLRAQFISDSPAYRGDYSSYYFDT
jgi:hypothetical protein